MDLHAKIEQFLQKTIFRYYQDKTINIFDQFVEFCQEYYDGPAHSLAEIKTKKNTKLKGDIFEHFAQKYFQHCYRITFQHVWLLKETPDPVLEKLKLQRHDLGIDIIAETLEQKYYAIQVKYRKKGYKATHGIPWQQLSTFYGLINRTGPYEKHIVFTNANYARHIGRKNKKDESICYGTLKNISLESWLKLSAFAGEKLTIDAPSTIAEIQESDILQIESTPLVEPIKKKVIIRKKGIVYDITSMREKRLEYFQSIGK